MENALKELIAELTILVRSMRAGLELAGSPKETPGAVTAAVEPDAAALAPKRGRKSKTETSAAAEPVAPPAMPPMSEDESRQEVAKLAPAYIRLDEIPAAQIERQTKARNHLSTAYKVSRTSDLTHPQRIEFANWLRSEIAEARNGVLAGAL